MNSHYIYSKKQLKRPRSVIDAEEDDEVDAQTGNVHKKIKLPFFENLFPNNDTDVYIEDNHIYFRTDVDLDSMSKLCKLIKQYNHKVQQLKQNPLLETVNPKPLYLHITSYGGYISPAFMAYDYIKNSNVPVHTIVEGYAASAGTLLSVAGVKRMITPQSQMLIHQLRGGASGKFDELEEDMMNTRDMMKQIVKIYLENTKGKMTKKQIEEALKHDLWWDAKKCIAQGLCDEILTTLVI